MRLKLASPRLSLVNYTIDDRRHYSIGIPVLSGTEARRRPERNGNRIARTGGM